MIRLKNLFDRANRARLCRRSISELNRLDDHLLSDLGISRSQLPLLACGTVDRQEREARRNLGYERAMPVRRRRRAVAPRLPAARPGDGQCRSAC